MANKPANDAAKPAATVYPKTFDFDTGVAELGSRRITMTFGLLTELSQDFQTMEDFQATILEQDRVITLANKALAERDEEGKILSTNRYVVTRLDPTPEEFERLATWLLGHVLSFFTKRTRAFSEATVGSQSELGALVGRLSKLKTG